MIEPSTSIVLVFSREDRQNKKVHYQGNDSEEDLRRSVYNTCGLEMGFSRGRI